MSPARLTPRETRAVGVSAIDPRRRLWGLTTPTTAGRPTMGKPPDPPHTADKTDPLFPLPGVPGRSAAQVADLLETLHAASVRLAAEMPELAATPAAVSQRTVLRLRRLAADLTPGAQARIALADVDAELLLAGAATWAARRPLLPITATSRAQLRWSTTPRAAAPTSEGASS